jgi:signal peptidase II
MIAIAVAILVLDLVTKYVFDAKLEDGETVSVIPYLFNFERTHNYGAAWGMLAGKQVFLIVLTFIFLAVFIAYYAKEKNKTWLMNITFGFLFAGCLGNLYDRLVLGYVRDFIQFAFWQSFPVFNFADAALTIGIVLLMIYLAVYFVKDSKRKKDEKPNE